MNNAVHVCCHSASMGIKLLGTRLRVLVYQINYPYLCPQILDENAQLIRVGDICTVIFTYMFLLAVFIMTGTCREHEHQRKINGMYPVSMIPLCLCALSGVSSLVPRPPPSFPALAVRYCKCREAGQGPGNEAMV